MCAQMENAFTFFGYPVPFGVCQTGVHGGPRATTWELVIMGVINAIVDRVLRRDLFAHGGSTVRALVASLQTSVDEFHRPRG